MRRGVTVPALAAALLLAVPVVTSCSSDDSTAAPKSTMIAPGRPGEANKTVTAGPPTATAPTAADIAFVRMMIPHHEQAITMASLVPKQAGSAEVKALADRIDKAQTVEISALQAWLKPHRERTGDGHAGHGGPARGDGDHAAMPGMATEAQLTALRAARGAEFDRQFLTLMITHHQGAVTMARDVMDKGSDPTVQEIAKEVLATQSGEINRMRDILDG